MSARIEGLPEARAALKNLTEAAQTNVRREVKRAALNVQNGARTRVPVDTGRLRNSIAHQLDADEMGAQIGTNVKYAKRIEFGFKGTDSAGRTYSQRPQPYLFPAFDFEAGRFKAAIAHAIRSAVR